MTAASSASRKSRTEPGERVPTSAEGETGSRAGSSPAVVVYLAFNLAAVLGLSFYLLNGDQKILNDAAIAYGVLAATGVGAAAMIAIEKLRMNHANRRVREASVELADARRAHEGERQSYEATQSSLKTRQAELEANETFLTAVLENVSDGIVACDSEGRLSIFNAAAKRFHGADVQQADHEEWAAAYDLYEPDGETPLSPERIPLWRAFNGEQVVDQAIVIAPRGLPRRTLVSRASALFDGRGEKIGAVATMRDVTTEYVQEARLQAQNDQLEFLFDAVPARIWLKDRHNVIVRLNLKAAESMGVPREKAAGANTYDLFPEMAEKYHQDDLSVIRSGKPKLGIIEPYTPRDGEQGWVWTDKIPYTDPTTGEEMILVVALDMTKEKDAENRVRESEQQLRAILDASSDGFWDWRLDRDVQEFSPGFWRMLGFDPDAPPYPPADWRKLIFPDDLKALERRFNEYIASKATETYEQELRFRHVDGSTVYILSRGGVVEWGADGEAVRMVGVHADITHVKQAEESLRRSNQELENFARVASHDLQEPLRKLLIYSEFLEKDFDGAMPPRAKEDLDAITDAAKRMHMLVKDMLSLARISGQKIEMRPVDPRRALEAAMSSVAALCMEKRAVIVFDDLPVVLGDETLLTQIYQNLISNALKFVAPGRLPRLHITAEVHENGVTLGLRDNGIGIEASHHEKIFQPLTRLHGRDQFDGSGIGLAICRRAAESLGGRMWVESSLGEGAHFRFSLHAPAD